MPEGLLALRFTWEAGRGDGKDIDIAEN